MIEIEAGGRRVVFTMHAVTRWCDRARPDLTWEGAVDCLRQKLDVVASRPTPFRSKRPSWAHKTRDLKHQLLTECYLVMKSKGNGAEVCFPLTRHGDELVATTCLVQGWDRKAAA